MLSNQCGGDNKDPFVQCMAGGAVVYYCTEQEQKERKKRKTPFPIKNRQGMHYTTQ